MMRTGNSSQCKFGENCTFAYNQLEIDVWTMERTGKLDRKLLFETSDKLDPVNCIIRLLEEFKGVFVFICQVSDVIQPVIAVTKKHVVYTSHSNGSIYVLKLDRSGHVFLN